MNPLPDEQRVAVTGLGLVTPLGPDRESSWRALSEGGGAAFRNGHRAPVQESNEARAIYFARLAAMEAVLQAGRRPPLGERTAIVVSGSKPLLDVPVALPPEAIPRAVAEALGAGGPVMNVSSACATGAHAVMVAAEWIREGRCDSVLAGASESSFHPLYVAGFSRMGVLSAGGRTRPFNRDRDGFVMGEGAGVFHLESFASARRRGAPILGEVSGWHFGCDAGHPVQFRPGGRRVAGALSSALRRAGVAPEELDYVNAHGTATRLNDALEAEALASVFTGNHRPLVSSTKGATGHMLGATGAVELGFCLLAMRDGRVPPTLHMDAPETDALDFVADGPRKMPVHRAASLSFGFGGAIAAVVLEAA